jgi:hypothetical protein
MMIRPREIDSLTVMTMQVPCCAGLLHLAKGAVGQAARKLPIKSQIVSLQGDILLEEWI